MRINNNISALNTYRQLGLTNLASSKAMERLSSGFRINRAGDDAAGLSISEKMRAQIRALNQASRNALDAISLIQTAEGALQETHAILQRMRELAVQSSSDTNVNELDREAIQNEFTQLKAEIDRIGNTTEFNTKKLLDGGRQIKSNAVLSGEELTGGKSVITHNVANLTHVNGSLATAATKTATNNLDPATDISTLNDAATFTIKIDGVDYTVTGSQLKAGKTANWGGTGTADDMVAWLASNMKDTSSNSISTVATLENDDGKLKITTISTNGTSSKISISFTDGAAGDTALMRTLTGIAATDDSEVTGTNATAAYSQFQFTANPTQGANLTLFTGEKIVFYDSTDAQWTGMTTDEIKASLSADYLVQIGATPSDTVANLAATVVTDFTIEQNPGGSGNDYVRFTYAATGPQTGNMVAIGSDTTAAEAARGYITFSENPTEGAYIEISGQKIAFYDSSLGNYEDDITAKAGLEADFVVDLKDKTLQQVVDSVIKLNASINTAADRDVSLSRENRADGAIRLNIAATDTGFIGNLINIGLSEDGTTGFNARFQIGANQGQNMEIGIADMRAEALGISEVKLSSRQGAEAAITTINNAINKVSNQRSELGAFQNRLEHTIKNLDNSSENLQAAESRIRDVDMAKEMMEFTKMSILQQAATAMLAQANQQPQAVLQLLR